MSHEAFEQEEQQKVALADEVTNAVKDFYRFLRSNEHRKALLKAVRDDQDLHNHGRQSPGLEALLANYDPEQHKRALGLEDSLKKLHRCVVSYKTLAPGEDNPAEWIMYVKDHVVDLNTLVSWTVGLCVEDVPVTQADIESRNWFIQPLGDVFDFRVVSLEHAPME